MPAFFSAPQLAWGFIFVIDIQGRFPYNLYNQNQVLSNDLTKRRTP